jgi:hypothetical protein
MDPNGIAHLDERAHDEDGHLDGAARVENASRHERAMFREHERGLALPAPA